MSYYPICCPSTIRVTDNCIVVQINISVRVLLCQTLDPVKYRCRCLLLASNLACLDFTSINNHTQVKNKTVCSCRKLCQEKGYFLLLKSDQWGYPALPGALKSYTFLSGNVRFQIFWDTQIDIQFPLSYFITSLANTQDRRTDSMNFATYFLSLT